MALELNFSIDEDLVKGSKLRFTDTTGSHDPDTNPGGYDGGGNPSKSDIQVTRILSGDVIRRRNTSVISDKDNLQLWREYKNDLSVLVFPNNMPPYLSYRDPFVLPFEASDSYLHSNNNPEETGRSLIRKDYVPADGAIDFVPGDFDVDGNVIPDRVYDIEYEVYVDLGSSFADANAGQVVADNQYIVIPDDPTNTSTVPLITLNNGDNYFRYQVFVPDSTQSISTSDATVYELEASTHLYFNTKFENLVRKLNLTKALVSDCNLEKRYKEEIRNFWLDFEAYENAISPTCMPNLSDTQDLVARMENHYDYLTKCLNL